MKLLRSEKGCPWDREQNHRSIAHNLLEETYEAFDAIQKEDANSLKEELGDVLLQIVFHAQMASEEDKFDIDDVVRSIISKIKRRHPHVFGNQKLKSSKEVLEQWEKIKKEDKDKGEATSVISEIPSGIPSLIYALKLQKKASEMGLDWQNVSGVYEKIKEEISELEVAGRCSDSDKVEEEIGDLFFSILNLSRHLGVDPELALRRVSNKFKDRVKYVEKRARQLELDLKSASLEELENLWQEAKRKES